jgi:hypothetical protein
LPCKEIVDPVRESSFLKRPSPLGGLEKSLTVLGIVQDYLRRRSARFNLGAHLLDLLCLLFELRSDRCFKFAAVSFSLNTKGKKSRDEAAHPPSPRLRRGRQSRGCG